MQSVVKQRDDYTNTSSSLANNLWVILVDTVSWVGRLPESTNSLPESMLTYHQWDHKDHKSDNFNNMHTVMPRNSRLQIHIMSSKQTSNEIVNTQRNFIEDMFDLKVSAVSADGLAPSGGRTSAVTVITGLRISVSVFFHGQSLSGIKVCLRNYIPGTFCRV